MIEDRVGAVIGIVGSMVLVGSALIAGRRRWRGNGWKMALAWGAILILLILTGRWLDSVR